MLDFLRWRNFDGLGYAGRGLGRGVDLLLGILFLCLLVRLGLSDMSAKGVDDRYFWLVLGLRLPGPGLGNSQGLALLKEPNLAFRLHPRSRHL